MIKALKQVGTVGTYLNIINITYDNSTANGIFNGKKKKAFLLRSGTRQGCPLSPLVQHSIGRFNQTAIRQKIK